MSHFFVTGAGGFIGSVVARALAVAGHRVSALHRGPVPTSLVAAGVTAIQGDLRDPTRFPERYDALIHAGAVIPARNMAGNDFAAVNIAATEALLAQASTAGAKRVIFCSSMSVYGRVTEPVVAVDTPPCEVDDYGCSKQAGEAAMADWTCAEAGRAGLSLRLPGIVGVGSHHNFLSDVATRIFDGAPVTARNSTGLFNNIVHVDDLAAFMGDWLVSGAAGHVAVPIASRTPIPIKDVLENLFAAADRPFDVAYEDSGAGGFTIDPSPAKALGYS
ncbi:MAG: NAD(P)-dependent oxidoreductase, partial [Pseudomonadota bacterium]|nr:NAD(P)-dependent oxidoreductase [Pseudomonadota bacterium]